ncbi:MAG: hypothetical protein BJ554DRAFT_5373 [Olpidium bornovanus]|uniref:HD domain-containing protein n=1 Tax=Olpidium bornovanus TaxID=278681 RepID=A0A8H8A1Y6_9FUNG|nr:MAG: hypothetical protein BJ554DRAFT_5373 [Olpidium bornovanus]
MAVVHDLAEAIVPAGGDTEARETPAREGLNDGTESKGKVPTTTTTSAAPHPVWTIFAQEAMDHMCKTLLGDSPAAREIYSLWLEYEEAETKEALFVKDIDKFEMLVQALEYETGAHNAVSFVFSARARVSRLYISSFPFFNPVGTT